MEIEKTACSSTYCSNTTPQLPKRLRNDKFWSSGCHYVFACTKNEQRYIPMSKEQRQRAAMISLLCLRNGTVGRRVSFFQKIRERHSSMDRTGKILVTFDTTHALCLERRETNQNEGTTSTATLDLHTFVGFWVDGDLKTVIISCDQIIRSFSCVASTLEAGGLLLYNLSQGKRVGPLQWPPRQLEVAHCCLGSVVILLMMMHSCPELVVMLRRRHHRTMKSRCNSP